MYQTDTPSAESSERITPEDSSSARPNTVATSGVELERSANFDPDKTPLPKSISRLVTALMVACLIAFPLAFGAVHPTTYLLERMLIVVALLFFWLKSPGRIQWIFSPSSHATSSTRLVVTLLLCVLGYLTVQSTILANLSSPHPVLGTSSAIVSFNALLEGMLTLVTFSALFLVTRAWLGSLQRTADHLLQILFLAGFVVGLTALSHWFYDNGKLFWTFEPETVFSSPRARWPFVNSNHLGHFLLPILFVALGALRATLHDLKDIALSTHRTNKRTWSLLFQSSRVQTRVIRLAFLALLVLSSSVAIIASLSRGSWLGMAIGLFVFLIMTKLMVHRSSTPSPIPAPGGSSDSDQLDQDTDPYSAKRHRSKRPRRPSRRRPHQPLTSYEISHAFERLSKIGTPIVLFLGAGLVYFFLFGRGSDLFFDRLQYGLLHSHEDIRFQLYSDTLGMLGSHWFLGVGLGAWAHYYPQYSEVLLSGINPVYLHNDPFQMLVEFGLPGALLMLALPFALLVRVSRNLLDPASRGGSILLGTATGLLGLCIASFVDFPFHIPAIISLSAILLALLVFYLDKHELMIRNSHNERETFSPLS